MTKEGSPNFVPPAERIATLHNDGRKRDTVLGWIHSGRLPGVNTARRQCGRPLYRIARSDLDAFIAGRTKRPEPKRTKRRNLPETDVIEFFPS